MRIAITGVTGFLGRALAAHLSALGHECVGLSRNPAAARSLGLPGVADFRTVENLPAVDAVIHLAGESPAGLWTARKRRKIFSSRVDGTQALVSAFRCSPPEIFLCASGVGIYGHRPGEQLDESSMPDPQLRFRAKVCLAWEREAIAASEFGTRVVHLRLGNVLDPRGGLLAKLLLLHRLGANIVLGNPAGAVPWISLLDAMRLIGFSLEVGALHGPLNIVSPYPISQHALARALAQVVGRPIRGRIPAPLLRCALGELSSALVDDQYILPAKALDAGFVFAHPAWRGALDAIFGDMAQPTKSAIS